jgi:uncharacterized protein YcbK (DUF882 family)
MTRRLFAVAVGIAIAMSVATVEAKPRHAKHSAKAHHSHSVKKHHHWRRAAIKTTRRNARHVRGHATADRGCLVPSARALLARIEAQFGPVQVISTCRRGAVIAGSGRPSMHRYGMAFDFRTPHKAAVVRWLSANNSGGTMTYRHSNHVHADVGRHFVALGGGKARSVRATKYAQRHDRQTPIADRNAAPAASSQAGTAGLVSPDTRYLISNNAYAYAASDGRHTSRRRVRNGRRDDKS